MFRATLFATLVGTSLAQRPEHCDETCSFDLTALEEFSVQYDAVRASAQGAGTIVTETPPATVPSDHGSIAVHARHLQLKIDNHLVIPADFRPPGPPNPILAQLAGSEIREELHINGPGGQASYHLSSPILNACIQLDNLPNVEQNHRQDIDRSLQQAQMVATMQVQNAGVRVTVDGEPAIGIQEFPNMFAISNTSQPVLVAHMMGPSQIVGLKFHDYVNSVGDQFSVRACEIETRSSTQTALAGNPEARDFIAQRIASHQRRLQDLLEPVTLNTRFNFIPLEIADLMMAPSSEGCTNDVLAQTTPAAESTFPMAGMVAACSFVMGVAATYGALRKKSVAPTDVYHEVSA